MPGPIQGIRVLELSQIMAGPTCGLLLADLGAEVIKIEKIPGGDDTRKFLPPDIKGESAAFMMMNRNKKGLALNLKEKEGIEIFKTISPRSSAVSYVPMKNSSALIKRCAVRLCKKMVAFNAISNAGISAAGSANATLPPIVPRFLMAL